MHSRTTAAGSRPGGAAEAEDDDLLWQTLRVRAALKAEAPADAQHPESAPGEDDWEALRARANMRHAMELRLAGRGFKAPPPLPRSQVPISPEHPLPMPYVAPRVPKPPLPRPVSSGGALPMTALDDDLDDLFPLLSSRRQALPMMLAACVAMGALGTALLRHFMSVAERQANIERVVHDIQIASARRPASPLTEPVAASAQAEPPTSETLRAFLRLNTPASPPPVPAPVRHVVHEPASPSEAVVERKQAVTSSAHEKSVAAARAADETEVTPDLPDLSGEPAFGSENGDGTP